MAGEAARAAVRDGVGKGDTRRGFERAATLCENVSDQQVKSGVARHAAEFYLTWETLGPERLVKDRLQDLTEFEAALVEFDDGADARREMGAYKRLLAGGVTGGVVEQVASGSEYASLRRSTACHHFMSTASPLLSRPHHRPNLSREAYSLLVVEDESRGLDGIRGCLEDWERRRRGGGGEAASGDEKIVEFVRGLLAI